MDYLKQLGCRRYPHFWILDGFDHEFYLAFDDAPDDDRPTETVDCYICIVGSPPDETKIRFKADCSKHDVMRILAAIGINRFGDATKKVFYELSNPLRK